MSSSNERPDLATRQVTSDDNKPKPPNKEFERKMEELRLRLQMEKASELERQKEILQRNYEAELQRILHQKEKELKEARSETKRIKEDLTLQVRDAERRLAQTPPVCKEGFSRRLVTEVVELKGVKRRLEEALGDVMDSDKRKACELRKLHDEHAAELGRFKKEAENEIRKLLAELKVKDRIIRQLKRELWVANERQQRLLKHQCQSQSLNKSKTGPQDGGNEKAANTHNLITKNSNSLNNTTGLDRRNPNKRKHVSNSNQNSDVEDRQHHDADEPDVKHRERKILKTGQVPETMYKRLYKEHLELQRSFALLRQMITDTKEEKGKCKNVALLADENQKLHQISQHLKIKIQKLRQELKESRDQNELLEFCVLEMENQGKSNSVPKLVERGTNTDPPNELSTVKPESREFDALVEAYPHKEVNEEEVKEIRSNLTYIYTAQGTNASSKNTLVQATAHIQAASTTITNLKNLVTKLTKDIEVAKKEKESSVSCSAELKQNYEECKQQLEKTEMHLLDVSERLASMQRREATLSHLEQINRKFKEHLQVVLQDFQVLLSDCADGQTIEVDSLKEKINELYKIEKEVILQAEKARIPQACPNPLEVAKGTNVTLKPLDTSCYKEVNNSAETVEELRLELWKQKLITEEFEKRQKDLLENCNELSLKLAEYESVKYDLMQKVAILEKSEQDLVEKNLKLYIDYVSAKEEVQKLLVELENRSPTSPLELRNIVSIQCSDVQRTLSEESGTMTSEDEGLGEESRRGDSTGPSSLADLQESDDLLTRTSDLESETLDENKSDLEMSDVGLNKLVFVEECAKINFKWKKEVAELKEREKLLIKRLKYSQVVIAELRKNIKVKEEQVQQLLGGGCSVGHDKHCEELQQVIKNMQKDLVELEEKLSLTELSKNSLKEQVLELEEAENDARLAGQKLQEKLILAVQQGSSIQKELQECKNHLEQSHCKIHCHDNATEIDLHSQIKYMEFLVNKYEDHIKELETSKMKLQQRVFCLEQLLQSAEALTSVAHQYRANKMVEDVDIPKTHSDLDHNNSNNISKSLTDLGTSTIEVSSPISRSAPLNINRTFSLSSKLSSYLSINLEGKCSSAQEDLLQRLNILEKDDQTLREQLHQIDGINLELWKKLHSLENHVGQCMKEYITELNEASSAHFPDSNVPLFNLHESLPLSETNIKLNPSIKLFEEKTNPFTEDLAYSGTHGILQRVLSLETSEHKLKDRLIQLESINREFERELEIRERLYKEKESQQRKWIDAENILQKTIRTLENEKSDLLNNVLRLEEEKMELNKTIENLQIELESLKEKHILALKELEINKKNALTELEGKQTGFDALAKEKAEKIVELEKSMASVSSPSKIELNMEKYNLLQSELDKLKRDHAALKESAVEQKNNIHLVTKDFAKQLNALIDLQKSEEEKLKLEIESLVAKEKEYNLQIIETLQKQTALESELISKENELEQMKKHFAEQMKLLEDERRVIEAELKWKMKEMEENASVTIKALTEERSKLENDLQADLRDLHSKEESYKRRIAELEGCIENLRKEVNQIANADLLPNSEKLALQSGNDSFLKKMEDLEKNEKQMKEKLTEMEKKEEAYKETLEHAEKIIATLERNYNEKLEELESSERTLKLKVSQLEEVESRLHHTLHNEKRTSEMRKASDLIEELIEGEIREAALRERIKELETNQKTLIEKLQELEESRRYLQEELNDHDEMVQTIEKLQQQLEMLKKELLEEQQSKNALQETLDHADDILIQREDELRQGLVRVEDENKELEETTSQLRKQVKELQSAIETSQYGKVSPIGEHLYETFSNCDSEEEFQQSDENFYLAERTGSNVEKVKELERAGNDLKQEVTHLKQSLSAANTHLIDLDSVNRKQLTTISQLEKEKILLQQQTKNYETLENKYKELEQYCNEQESARTLLQKSLEELQEKQKWWEGLKDINCQLQKQVSLLQKQLSNLNPDNSTTAFPEQGFEGTPCVNNKEHSAIGIAKNPSTNVIQERVETELQHNSVWCGIPKDAAVKCKVHKLSRLCQTVVNSSRPFTEQNSCVSDKEDNKCLLQIDEHCEKSHDTLSEGEIDIINTFECGRHSPMLWSAVPGTVSLDDLTTGLEAQLELEQCVKSAMAAMEREMVQKETSQIPADNGSFSSKCPHVDSTSPKAVSSNIEHSSNITNNSKGTITKGKTKILDVSELQQSEKCLSSVIPHPPTTFRILRQIGDHSLLVGWSVPKEGCTIGGYQIYVDGQLHQKVRSPDRTKALLPKINVSQPVNISIYSISTSGHTSEPASVHHSGALLKREDPLCKKEMPYTCITEHSCVLRIRTVYNEGYDVAVQKGSSVLVCSPPDSDGFCTVQVEGQEGKLPFSVLKEVKNSS